MHHRARNFIPELFREQGKIKTKHRQRKFITELFRGRGQTMFNGDKKSGVPNFNVSDVFECGRNNPDMSYERAYMDTEGNEYFMDILDHLKKYQDHHG